MARNERDHLIKERMRLLKRKIQIEHRLTEINEDMDGLLKQAQKKAAEIRGEGGIPVDVNVKKGKSGRPKMTLEY